MSSVKVAPSILSSDFSRLGDEVRTIIEAGADLIHVDVHLMISDPMAYVADFAHAGADIITFHVEATDHPLRVIDTIKELGCRAGIVLNPGTPEDDIEFITEHVDMVLVMTVNPGFGGQAFIPDMLRKIQNVRAMMGDRDVEVDGGIDDRTAPQVIEAGANILVAGSYVFRHASYLEAIESLRGNS